MRIKAGSAVFLLFCASLSFCTPSSSQPSTILRIISDPEGASIWIDRLYFGQSPHQVKLYSGTYTVKLKKLGYEEYTSQVHLIEGEETVIQVKLERKYVGVKLGSVIKSPEIKDVSVKSSVLTPHKILDLLTEISLSGIYDKAKKIENHSRIIARYIPRKAGYPFDRPNKNTIRRYTRPFEKLNDRIKNLQTVSNSFEEEIMKLRELFSGLTDLSRSDMGKLVNINLPKLRSKSPRGEITWLVYQLRGVNNSLEEAIKAKDILQVQQLGKKGLYITEIVDNLGDKISGEAELIKFVNDTLIYMYEEGVSDPVIQKRQPHRLILEGWAATKEDYSQRKKDLIDVVKLDREEEKLYKEIIKNQDKELLHFIGFWDVQDYGKIREFIKLTDNAYVKKYHEVLQKTDAGKVTEWRNVVNWHPDLWYFKKAAKSADFYSNDDKEFIIIMESFLSPTLYFITLGKAIYAHDIAEKKMKFEWDKGKGNDEEFLQSALREFPSDRYRKEGVFRSLKEIERRKEAVCSDHVAMMIQELHRAYDKDPDNLPLPAFPIVTMLPLNAEGKPLGDHAILIAKTSKGYSFIDASLKRQFNTYYSLRQTYLYTSGDIASSDWMQDYWFGKSRILIPLPDAGIPTLYNVKKLLETDNIGKVMNIPYFPKEKN